MSERNPDNGQPVKKVIGEMVVGSFRTTAATQEAIRISAHAWPKKWRKRRPRRARG